MLLPGGRAAACQQCPQSIGSCTGQRACCHDFSAAQQQNCRADRKRRGGRLTSTGEPADGRVTRREALRASHHTMLSVRSAGRRSKCAKPLSVIFVTLTFRHCSAVRLDRLQKPWSLMLRALLRSSWVSAVRRAAAPSLSHACCLECLGSPAAAASRAAEPGVRRTLQGPTTGSSAGGRTWAAL